MSDLLNTLQAIEADICTALKELDLVMEFVETQSAPPSIKVRILNSVIVAAVSVVEEGLRNLFFEYLLSLEKKIVSYSHLPVAIKKSNYNCCIEIMKSQKKKTEDASSTIAQLGKCIDDAAGYKLFSNELTFNKFGFKSEHLGDLAKSIGFERLWLKIVNDSTFHVYTNEDNLEVRQNIIIATWNEIFDERDTIVHRVSQASGWGKEKISEAVSFFEMIIKRMKFCLDTCATEHVDKYLSAQPPSL